MLDGTAASGVVAGRSWAAPLVRGVYCEHCGGGESVQLLFRSYVGSGAVVSLTGQGPPLDAVSGEVEMDACDRGAARGSFSVELEDGSEISGRFAARLRFDAGYE